MYKVHKQISACVLVVLCVSRFALPCCINMSVAILMDRSPRDLPFIINRTIGVINIGMEKAREIVKDSVNLKFILRYADVPTCSSLKFGALAAEVYHDNEMHAIIGPGKPLDFISSVVCEQHRSRPAFASAQSDQRLCYSLFEKKRM